MRSRAQNIFAAVFALLVYGMVTSAYAVGPGPSASGGISTGNANADAAIATVFAQPVSNVTQTRNISKHFGDNYNFRDFVGGYCDTQVLSGTSSITAGSNIASDSSYSFATTDVGKVYWITGAGTSGQTFVSTITSVSGGKAYLAANAVTTVSGATATYGHDDTSGINLAFGTMNIEGGGRLNFPGANCMASQGVEYAHEMMNGQGIGATAMYQIPGTNKNFFQTAGWAGFTGSSINYGTGANMYDGHGTSPNVPQWYGATNMRFIGDRSIPLTPTYTGYVSTNQWYGYISNGTSGTPGNILTVTSVNSMSQLTLTGSPNSVNATVPAGAYIVNTSGVGANVVIQPYGTSGTTGTGGVGTYIISGPAIAVGTSAANGQVQMQDPIILHVTAVANGTLAAAQPEYGFRIPPGTALGAIGAYGTTGTGGTGTYSLVFPNASAQNNSLTTNLNVVSQTMYGQSNMGFAGYGNEAVFDQVFFGNLNDWGYQLEASYDYAYNSTDYRSQEEAFLGTIITHSDRAGFHSLIHDATAQNLIDAESDDFGFMSEYVAGANGGIHLILDHNYTETSGRGYYNFAGGTVLQLYQDNNHGYAGAGVVIGMINNVQCVGNLQTGDCFLLAASNSYIGGFQGTMHAGAYGGAAGLHITGQQNVVNGFEFNQAGAGAPQNNGMYALRVDGPFNTVTGQVLGVYGNSSDYCVEVNGTNNIIDVTDVNCYAGINFNYSKSNDITIVNYGATVPTVGSTGQFDHFKFIGNTTDYETIGTTFRFDDGAGVLTNLGGVIDHTRIATAAVAPSFQGYIAGATAGSTSTTLTVTTPPTNGPLYIGEAINCTGCTSGTTITALGTGAGGVGSAAAGTYTVSTAQNVGWPTGQTSAAGIAMTGTAGYYSFQNDHNVMLEQATAAAAPLYLPFNPTVGQHLIWTDASGVAASDTLTVKAINAAGTSIAINGLTSGFTYTTAYEGADFWYDGSGWKALAMNLTAAGSGGGSGGGTTLTGTSDDVVYYNTSGNAADSGVLLSSLAPLASPSFTGVANFGGSITDVGGATLGGNLLLQAPGTATSGTSIASPSFSINGVAYNGSSAVAGMTCQYTPPTSFTYGAAGAQGVVLCTFPGDSTSNTSHLLEFSSSNQAISLVNSNDSLGAMFEETYAGIEIGLQNTKSSAQGSIPANSAYQFLTITDAGKTCTDYPLAFGSSSCRNTLDDGSGNGIVAGSETAKSYVTTVYTITYSATPAINPSYGSLQTITLTGNASPTTAGIVTGSHTLVLKICQDSTGSRTWTWPSTVHGGMTIGATASTCSIQAFDSWDGTNLYAESAGITNVQ